MATNNIGKITQIIGAVLDIKFTGKLPEIYEAIKIQNGETLLVAEVAQHLGDDTVRCIAMGPTDGLVRGMDAEATGAPISVPVGEKTLGRMFNVLGNPIDEKPAPEGVEYFPIHRKAPASQRERHKYKSGYPRAGHAIFGNLPGNRTRRSSLLRLDSYPVRKRWCHAFH